MGWPPPPYSRSYLVTQVYKIGPTVQRSVCNGGLCCVLSNPAVSQMQCFIWGRLRLLLYYDGRRQATQVPLGKCILRERIKSMIKMRCNLSSCPFSLRWGEARSYSWCVMWHHNGNGDVWSITGTIPNDLFRALCMKKECDYQPDAHTHSSVKQCTVTRSVVFSLPMICQ